MGMMGSLNDMAIADLIQLNCLDRKTAKLQIQHASQQATIFFKNGNFVHAVLGNQVGEEVIYQILKWKDGKFNLERGVEPPTVSNHRSWSSVLMEGARRLDEYESKSTLAEPEGIGHSEANKMVQNFEAILNELADEVTGYKACALVGIDGINVAAHVKNDLDTDTISAQMTMLIKLLDGSVEKLGAGTLEDNLTTTENAYFLMRFLPGKQYYLDIVADRKTGNLGNMRLMSRMYTERLAKAMAN
jgi:predicted regulator of Ras-like GTPase activity (Roadblock/LC7/MglB family)